MGILGAGIVLLCVVMLHKRAQHRENAAALRPEADHEVETAGEDVRQAMNAEAIPSAPPIATVKSEVAGLAISLMFEPVRLSATLVNATLAYRLVVGNTGHAPLRSIAIAGGMISAHASLPVEHQLGTDGQPLELLSEIEELAPGETREINGEIRLLLSEITPIRSGPALLFIPLCRFHVESCGASALAAYVIGETPPVPAAALLPFRIDMGPRIWGKVSARRVGMPARA